MKRKFVEPAVEVVSFLSQERLMTEGYLFEMEGDVGLDVIESAGSGDNWGEFGP